MPVDLDYIRLRCVEEGECWIWQQATSTTGAPVINRGGSVKTVRRQMAEEMGMPLTRSSVVSTKCGDPLCCHPDHLKIISRSEQMKQVAQRTQYGANPARNRRISEVARKRPTTRLTPEIVRELRETRPKVRDAAAKYKVSTFAIASAMRGDTWKDYSNPFSQLMR